MMFYEYDKITIITFLALFAAVGFKIIPSINKIIFAIQHLKFYLPASEIVIKDLKLNIEAYKINLKKITHSNIKIHNLSYKYPNTKNYVLKNVNLSIKKNEIIGITGSSGSGKSTFLNCLIGLLVPTQGKIFVDKTNIFNDIRSWQNKIGYVPQQVFLTDENIFSNIAFGVETKNINKKKIFKVSKISQLGNFLKKKEDYNNLIGERGVRISGGQMQRVGIARALYNDKDLLIFDEATSSLDPETEKNFLQSIESFRRKKTIFIISHKINTLKICDRVYKVNKKSFIKLKL